MVHGGREDHSFQVKFETGRVLGSVRDVIIY